MERFETVDDLANADLEELTSFIDEKGRNFADPAAKAKAIQTAARDSYRLPITVNNSVNQAMAVSIASMSSSSFVSLIRQWMSCRWSCISNQLIYADFLKRSKA